jgi:hypothetical protein
VLIGATPEDRKELVGFTDGARESAQDWRDLLLDLKRRGCLVVFSRQFFNARSAEEPGCPAADPLSARHLDRRFPASTLGAARQGGPVARLVGIEGGVVSGVFNLESSGVEALDWRPRHDEQYHEA